MHGTAHRTRLPLPQNGSQRGGGAAARQGLHALRQRGQTGRFPAETPDKLLPFAAARFRFLLLFAQLLLLAGAAFRFPAQGGKLTGQLFPILRLLLLRRLQRAQMRSKGRRAAAQRQTGLRLLHGGTLFLQSLGALRQLRRKLKLTVQQGRRVPGLRGAPQLLFQLSGFSGQRLSLGFEGGQFFGKLLRRFGFLPR